MKHNYNQRKQNRIAFAIKQAEKNTSLSESLYNEASKMASVIPFGQPILVGHHSEKRDRNYRSKITKKFDQSFEAQEKADYYEQKAETIENNDSIFSDDPEALQKLKDKLAGMERNQVFMKAANVCIRKRDMEAFLELPGATSALWSELMTPSAGFPRGYVTFSLSNNLANIKRTKDRIIQLEKMQTLKTTEEMIGEVRVVQNVEANRLQLFFPGIPQFETRQKLKKNGFHWAPSEGAWQRHLTLQAVQSAKYVLAD